MCTGKIGLLQNNDVSCPSFWKGRFYRLQLSLWLLILNVDIAAITQLLSLTCIYFDVVRPRRDHEIMIWSARRCPSYCLPNAGCDALLCCLPKGWKRDLAIFLLFLSVGRSLGTLVWIRQWMQVVFTQNEKNRQFSVDIEIVFCLTLLSPLGDWMISDLPDKMIST